MRITCKASCFLFVVAAAALSGCASTQPKPYTGIESSGYLRPNDQGRHGHEPYAYSADVDWKRYDSFIMDPVAIYRGPDHQFDAKITE